MSQMIYASTAHKLTALHVIAHNIVFLVFLDSIYQESINVNTVSMLLITVKFVMIARYVLSVHKDIS